MNNDYKDILLKILEAIDYADDKEAFVKEFTSAVQLQAVDNLIKSLPQDHQDSIDNNLTANKDNPEKVSEILKNHFSDEQMKKSLEDMSRNAMMEWIQAVNPTLSDQQRQKLLDLSQKLNPTPPPTI